MLRFVLAVEPGIDIALSKAQTAAKIQAFGQRAAVAMAVVDGLEGKARQGGKVLGGEKAFHGLIPCMPEHPGRQYRSDVRDFTLAGIVPA